MPAWLESTAGFVYILLLEPREWKHEKNRSTANKAGPIYAPKEGNECERVTRILNQLLKVRTRIGRVPLRGPCQGEEQICIPAR